jgi:hypothetical protein
MNRPHAVRPACDIALALTLLAGSSLAATSFDPYGIILDRKPFGEESVVAEPSLPPVPPEKSVVNQIRMSAVVRDVAGVLRVGLVDLKSNRNYMLGIGDSMDGIEVIAADYTKERARLRRGPEDYWVSMFGGSNRFERIVETVPAPTAVAAPSPTNQKPSYAKRRQQREEARLRAELERMRLQEVEKAASTLDTPREPVAGVIRAGAKRGSERGLETALSTAFSSTNRLDLSEEEIAQMLQEYQKELLRSGQPPLPIPLTPETDRQLVEEGILPPQE